MRREDVEDLTEWIDKITSRNGATKILQLDYNICTRPKILETND